MASTGTSLEGKLVVLVGGSGFFGTHLAQELLNAGARLRIASRNPERAFKLKPLANLGQVQFARCDMTRPESLARVLAGADAVVNLVGAFTGNLDAVQGQGAGTLARLAREAGAAAFVHVSAIGADAEGATAYARSKAAGEAAVLAAFPQATVLRPSVLFGSDDNFVNMFAGLSALPVLPVFAPGAKLQPLFVDDAAVPGQMVNGHRVLTYEQFLAEPASERHAALAIANGKVREALAARLKTDGVRPWSVAAANVVVMDDGRVVHAGPMSGFVNDEALQTRLLGLSMGAHT